jgi:hypothetical protein
VKGRSGVVADVRQLNRKAQSLKGAVPGESLERGADKGMGMSAAAVNDVMMAGIFGVFVVVVRVAVMMPGLFGVSVGNAVVLVMAESLLSLDLVQGDSGDHEDRRQHGTYGQTHHHQHRP